MVFSVCYHLCKPPLNFTTLFFLQKENPAFLQAQGYSSPVLWVPPVPTLSQKPHTLGHSFVFFFALFLLSSTPPSQRPLYTKCLNICKPNQSKSEEKKGNPLFSSLLKAAAAAACVSFCLFTASFLRSPDYFCWLHFLPLYSVFNAPIL